MQYAEIFITNMSLGLNSQVTMIQSATVTKRFSSCGFQMDFFQFIFSIGILKNALIKN